MEQTGLADNLTVDYAEYQDMLDEHEERMFKAKCIFWFEGVFVPIIGSVGILGNVLSIIVLTRRELDLKGSFLNLLVTLCVFDMLFILAVNLFYTVPIHSSFYEQELIPYLTPMLLPAIHIVLTGSVYSVVAVAVERYMIICNPFNCNVHGQGGRYIAAIVVISIVFNVNKFFEVGVDYVDVPTEVLDAETGAYSVVNVTRPMVVITPLRDNDDYTKAVILLNFIVMVVLPLLVLSVCHALTFRTIRENTLRHNAISNHQRRDNDMAFLFFIIITFFVVCHSGKFALNFFEISRIFAEEKEKQWPLWAFLLTRVNHFLLVINSSVNFFIYCFRDVRFRHALFSVVGLRTCIAHQSRHNQLNGVSRAARRRGDDVEAERQELQQTKTETVVMSTRTAVTAAAAAASNGSSPRIDRNGNTQGSHV